MTTTLVKVFSALADDTRWKILSRLGEGPASATALAREFPISRQAIIKHLDVLHDAGLAEAAPHGREIVYHALGGQLSEIARKMERIGTAWEKRLAEAKRDAEQGQRDT